MKITNEERKILESLSVSLLRFLSKIAEDKEFEQYKKFVNQLVDMEKNISFGLPEDDRLLSKHAYSRGRVGGYLESARIMAFARNEIERREAKRREAK